MKHLERKSIALPLKKDDDWRKVLKIKLNALKPGLIEIDCRDWQFNCRDIYKLASLLNESGCKLLSIQSDIPETIVSAAALGYQTQLAKNYNEGIAQQVDRNLPGKSSANTLFHKGTLRSGDHLKAEGDVLLLGDVNPGAKISAGGNVMVWGRLRGVAHAGKEGNNNARIIALQLRPLQLRIADVIARGPEEKPEPGLAEEAKLQEGRILIEPANPQNLQK